MNELASYQWLFRKAPAMATSIDADGRYLDLNDALLERLGYARDEMVGRKPVEFVTDECARRIEHEFIPQLRRTGKLRNQPIEFITKKGEVVELLTSSIVEQDPAGQHVRTVAVYTEIANSAWIERKFRELYRSTPAMLHTVDPDGHITAVSDHWLRKMGYSRDEVLGRSIRDFFSPDFREKFGGNRLHALISGGVMDNEDRQVVTRDGRVLDLVMSAIPERDSGGQVKRLMVASKDVTARNRAEAALRDALAENARLRDELERERDYLREEVNVAMNFGRIVGKSPALNNMMTRLEAVAQTPANVLILGESGVGKELVARAIHAKSARADGPLVKVNCASIPKDLFESEFFGHVKGAFTGAHRDRIGRFQLAEGGTLFLDEIGEIPLELQGKLLRVLQEREFERVGDDVTRTSDVRVITATNRDLAEAVEAGTFREDLYYRLTVFPIEVPPLRKRGDDVIQLAQHFLEKTCRDFGHEPMKLTQSHAEKLRGYDWPGNIRELKNVIERAVILSKGNVLRLDLSLPSSNSVAGLDVSSEGADSPLPFVTEQNMKEQQKNNIIAALRHANWRVSGKQGAAQMLGIRPTTLSDRMKSLGIRKPA